LVTFDVSDFQISQVLHFQTIMN